MRIKHIEIKGFHSIDFAGVSFPVTILRRSSEKIAQVKAMCWRLWTSFSTGNH